MKNFKFITFLIFCSLQTSTYSMSQIKRKAKSFYVENFENNKLMKAIQRSDINEVLLLIQENKFDINFINSQGDTAFSLAIKLLEKNKFNFHFEDKLNHIKIINSLMIPNLKPSTTELCKLGDEIIRLNLNDPEYKKLQHQLIEIFKKLLYFFDDESLQKDDAFPFLFQMSDQVYKLFYEQYSTFKKQVKENLSKYISGVEDIVFDYLRITPEIYALKAYGLGCDLKDLIGNEDEKRIAEILNHKTNMRFTISKSVLVPFVAGLGKSDNFDLLASLLEKGFDINAEDYANTPLTISIKNNNLKLTEFLLQHGADPNYQLNQEKIEALELVENCFSEKPKLILA